MKRQGQKKKSGYIATLQESHLRAIEAMYEQAVLTLLHAPNTGFVSSVYPTNSYPTYGSLVKKVKAKKIVKKRVAAPIIETTDRKIRFTD